MKFFLSFIRVLESHLREGFTDGVSTELLHVGSFAAVAILKSGLTEASTEVDAVDNILFYRRVVIVLPLFDFIGTDGNREAISGPLQI